jgi:hypothetical protein
MYEHCQSFSLRTAYSHQCYPGPSQDLLSAWCCAILVGLSRNHPAAEAVIKALPKLLDVKRDLERMLATGDSCSVPFLPKDLLFCFMIGLAADTMHATGFRAATIDHMLVDLSDYHHLIARIIETAILRARLPAISCRR